MTILLFFGALWLLSSFAMTLGLCYCASLKVEEDEFPLARNGEDSRERLSEPLGTHNAGCPGVFTRICGLRVLVLGAAETDEDRLVARPGCSAMPGAALTLSPPVPALAEVLGSFDTRNNGTSDVARASAKEGSATMQRTMAYRLPVRISPELDGEHAAGGDQFVCSSKRESARGAKPEHSQAGPQTVTRARSDDPSSRGSVRPAATTFRPACADADSPIRDNPR